jgi:hypothetical protein
MRGTSLLDEALFQRRLWSPLSLRPAAWFDASDLSTITLATGVSQWSDKSGFGRHATQGTGANQPSFNAAALNNNPSFSFNGSQCLKTPSFTIGTISSVFVVMKKTALYPFNDSYLWGSTLSTASNLHLTSCHNVYVLRSDSKAYVDGGTVLTSSSNVYVLNAWNILQYTVNGASNSQIVQNGTIVGTGNASGNSWTNGLSIGAASGAGNAAADFSEFMLFSTALADCDRQRVEGYLAWKWGLRTKLPASHPFVNTPPILGV